MHDCSLANKLLPLQIRFTLSDDSLLVSRASMLLLIVLWYILRRPNGSDLDLLKRSRIISILFESALLGVFFH